MTNNSWTEQPLHNGFDIQIHTNEESFINIYNAHMFTLNTQKASEIKCDEINNKLVNLPVSNEIEITEFNKQYQSELDKVETEQTEAYNELLMLAVKNIEALCINKTKVKDLVDNALFEKLTIIENFTLVQKYKAFLASDYINKKCVLEGTVLDLTLDYPYGMVGGPINYIISPLRRVFQDNVHMKIIATYFGTAIFTRLNEYVYIDLLKTVGSNWFKVPEGLTYDIKHVITDDLLKISDTQADISIRLRWLEYASSLIDKMHKYLINTDGHIRLIFPAVVINAELIGMVCQFVELVLTKSSDILMAHWAKRIDNNEYTLMQSLITELTLFQESHIGILQLNYGELLGIKEINYQ